jgi:hypothetical protein
MLNFKKPLKPIQVYWTHNHQTTNYSKFWTFIVYAKLEATHWIPISIFVFSFFLFEVVGMKSNFHMSNNYTITKLNFIHFHNDLSSSFHFINFFNSNITLNFVMHLIKMSVVILISLFFLFEKKLQCCRI